MVTMLRLCCFLAPKSPDLGDNLYVELTSAHETTFDNLIVLLVSWPWQVGEFLPQTEPLNQGTNSDAWATVVFQAWDAELRESILQIRPLETNVQVD